MDYNAKGIKIVRRLPFTDYVADQTISIGEDGGSDIVEDVPVAPNTALELYDEASGETYVVLAYKRK